MLLVKIIDITPSYGISEENERFYRLRSQYNKNVGDNKKQNNRKEKKRIQPSKTTFQRDSGAIGEGISM